MQLRRELDRMESLLRNLQGELDNLRIYMKGEQDWNY